MVPLHITLKQFQHSKSLPKKKKKLGVDKVKLLDQKVCPIYPERYINPNSKTVEYKGKTIYFWSSSALRAGRVTLIHILKSFDKGTFLNSKANL